MKRVFCFLAIIFSVVHGLDDLAKQVDTLNEKLLNIKTHSDIQSLTQEVAAMNKRLSKLKKPADLQDYIGLEITKEKAVTNKFNFERGNKKCVMELKAGNIHTSCDTNTPRKLAAVSACYAAECGNPGACAESPRCAKPDEKHEVRCCAKTQINKGWVKVTGCNVWADSEVNKGACVHSATYDAAFAVCKAAGARLCTQQELKKGCTKATGCGHDADLIWSSTIGNPNSCDQALVLGKVAKILAQLGKTKQVVAKLDKLVKQTKPKPKYKSCWEVKQANPKAASGWYTVYPPAGGTYKARCEMSKNGGGWTRFLQLNGKGKSCGNFKDVPLSREIVGNYCNQQEYTFSRSMMLNSQNQLMFTDDQGRMMWYRFTGCAKGSCTCDKAGSNANKCFFLAVTADYSGGRPLFNNAAEDYDMWSEAYDWKQKRWENQGDGQCGGTNANAHSQFNCEPSRQKNLGQCGQRWHYGCRHDGSHKGGSTCNGAGAGCAWNWYTGLATSWRGGCNADKSAWMINGPKANGQKRTAEVWFR